MSAFRNLTETQQIDRGWMESEIFPSSEELREQQTLDQRLAGKALYCLFYEPSFLTRTSFERAIGLLGGTAHHTEDASQFFPVSTPRHIDNIIAILASLHIDLVVLRSSDDGVVESAARAEAIPIINGGSRADHPTQALADIYTLQRELGGVDGIRIALVGRLEHRNVSALLRGLALFKNVEVALVPFSGQADPDVVHYCRERGMVLANAAGIEDVREVVSEVDAIYLNGPRTLAHARYLSTRGSSSLRIDAKFMSMLRPNCIILDPMQRSGDFAVEAQDHRLAFYRQAENALFVRMALLDQFLGR